MIEDALYGRLTGAGALAALVGDRVYPMRAPQDSATPYVTYQRVSGVRDRSYAGPSGSAQPRFQIDIWGRSFTEARAVFTQVRLALDGWRSAGSGVTVMATTLESDQDLLDTDAEPTLNRVRSDWFIHHTE